MEKTSFYVQCIEQACMCIVTTEPDLILYTDTSLIWWVVTSKVDLRRGFWHNE